jgi:hypothetical protein
MKKIKPRRAARALGQFAVYQDAIRSRGWLTEDQRIALRSAADQLELDPSELEAHARTVLK